MIIALICIFLYFLGVFLFFVVSVLHTYYFRENFEYIYDKKERFERSIAYVEHEFECLPWFLSWILLITFVIYVLCNFIKVLIYKLLKYILIR